MDNKDLNFDEILRQRFDDILDDSNYLNIKARKHPTEFEERYKEDIIILNVKIRSFIQDFKNYTMI